MVPLTQTLPFTVCLLPRLPLCSHKAAGRSSDLPRAELASTAWSIFSRAGCSLPGHWLSLRGHSPWVSLLSLLPVPPLHPHSRLSFQRKQCWDGNEVPIQDLNSLSSEVKTVFPKKVISSLPNFCLYHFCTFNFWDTFNDCKLWH